MNIANFYLYNAYDDVVQLASSFRTLTTEYVHSAATDGGNGITCDHADWADARLVKAVPAKGGADANPFRYCGEYYDVLYIGGSGGSGLVETVSTVETGLPESAHNYACNFDYTWTYTAASADFIEITFSTETKTEMYFDFIYLIDDNGNAIGQYSGTQLSGKTVTVLGSTAKIRLKSDSNNVDYGFKVTRIVAKRYTTNPANVISEATTGLPESVHNYADNFDYTWTYTASAQAEVLEVTFSSSTKVEKYYDKIYIMDGSGNVLETYLGSSLAGKTVAVPGNTVKIRLKTDSCNTDYGFKVTKIAARKNVAAGVATETIVGGNYYLRARYYDPRTSRMLSQDAHWNTGNMIYGDNPAQIGERKDPLGLNTYTYAPDINPIRQSSNLYVYCLNNPVLFTDPSGEAINLDAIKRGIEFMKLFLAEHPEYMANTQKFVTSTGNRIPDFLNQFVIGEIKDVSYLSQTAQLRGMMEIAEKTNKQFVLVIREGARLSQPLIDEIAKNNGIIINGSAGLAATTAASGGVGFWEGVAALFESLGNDFCPIFFFDFQFRYYRLGNPMEA